jgi:CHAT domain-containing protein
LSDSSSDHLLPNHIFEAATGTLADAAAKSHAEACPECKENIESWGEDSASLEVLRQQNGEAPTSDCPSMQDLANYCAGLAGERSGELLDHLSHCGRCVAIVGCALEYGEPETTPALRSSGSKWQREMAATFARDSKKGGGHWRYGGIAAAILLAAGGSLWWREQERVSGPARLLAQAYTEARPFEYRLPDRGYGTVRQTRGSGFDRPAALDSANVEIKLRLSTHAGDPEFLALKGQAQLLVGDHNGAIESLEQASKAKPDNSEFLSELGTAYAVRGSAEQRTIDYGHAVDLYVRALKKRPSSERDLYNLALTYQNLWLVEEAIGTWNKLLKLKPDPGWRSEAETHLAALEKIRQERKKAEDSVVKDPAVFAQRFATSPDFDPEQYHEIFWMEWLPAIKTNPAAAPAIEIEANEFKRRFNDGYLLEIVSAGRGKPGLQAILDLAAAVALNKSGQTDRAAAAAKKAASELHSAGAIAGELRAKIELAYANRRASKNAECLELMNEALRQAAPRSYPWLTGQAHMEHAGCAERLSQSGAARIEVANARRLLEKAGLNQLALRASGYVTGLDRMSGNYTPIWEEAPRGLQSYWTSAASPLRAQDFQFNLQWSARAMGWGEAAVVLDRASIQSLERAGNPEMEALNRVYFANLLKENREYAEATNEFKQAERLFHLISPGPTLENLTWLARLGRCEIEVEAGRGRDIVKDLEDLSANAGSRSSVDQMRVQQIRGLAFVATGEWQHAIDAFQKAVEWNQRKAASLPSYLDRIPILEAAAPSYRNLAELQLVRLHDTKSSLATWMRYQGGPSASEGGLSLTYAVLPSTIAIWTINGATVTSRFVEASTSEVEKTARRFLQLCSTPDTSEGEIRQLGNRLYRWLIEPELRGSPDAIIYLRTDSWLASIPFGAFVNNSGRYLQADRAFTNLLGAEETASPKSVITADSPALIVSVPYAQAAGQRPLAPLESVKREASEVSSRFHQPVVLEGPSVSAESITARSGESSIFHFTGHGWVNGGDGALILPPAADGDPRFETSREIAKQNWRQCVLAVLSACLTAAGEERGAVNNQSLVRAMLEAGARQVVAARWSVDSEATRALMGQFYSRVLSGEGVSKSLDDAGAELAKSANWRHPYYWAGFDTFTKIREP